MSRVTRMGVGTSFVFIAAAACADGAIRPDGPLVGRWGTVGVALVATEAGGTVEFDCAHGSFGPMVAEDGRFEVAGTWTRETGAVRVGEEPVALPATYDGLATGDRIVFTVQVAGEEGPFSPFGPFTVERGKEPLLRKCL